MLPTPVFLFGSASGGGGSYNTSLFFSPSSLAKYLRIDDIIEDSIGNQYKVTAWTGSPSDNGDGGTVVMTFVTADVTPTDSGSFDSLAFTPGQNDIRPEVQTDGTISSASVFSGQEFEYSITGAWTNSAEANKAEAGDFIIDKNGKQYEITFLDGTNRFTVPFRVKESEPEGIIPPDGTAALYSGTFANGLFQGQNINVLAETAIRNRDTFVLDLLIDDSLSFTNVEGTVISKTQIVFESAIGDVELARADDSLTPGKVIGIVKDSSITNGAIGEVYIKPGTRVFGFSGLTVNLPVYLSRTTAGEVTQSLSGFTSAEHVIRLGLALSSDELMFLPNYDFEY